MSCKGTTVCKHNIHKRNCKKCSTISSKCTHKKLKFNCVICNPFRYRCEHGLRRSLCKDCGGGSLCKKHGLRKDRCKDCGGSSICKHNKIKYNCKTCIKEKYSNDNIDDKDHKDNKIDNQIDDKEKENENINIDIDTIDYICNNMCINHQCCNIKKDERYYSGYCLSCFVNSPNYGIML